MSRGDSEPVPAQNRSEARARMSFRLLGNGMRLAAQRIHGVDSCADSLCAGLSPLTEEPLGDGAWEDDLLLVQGDADLAHGHCVAVDVHGVDPDAVMGLLPAQRLDPSNEWVKLESLRGDDGAGARVAGRYSKQNQSEDGDGGADRANLSEGSSLDRHCHHEGGEADQGDADQAYEDAARHHEPPWAHGQGLVVSCEWL